MFTPDRTLDTLLALTTGPTKDRAAAIDEALRATCQLVEAEAAAFLFYDGRRATRTTLLDSGARIAEEHPNPTEGLFRQVTMEGRAAIVNRPQQDPRFWRAGDAPAALEVRNVVAAPVRVRGQNMGVLVGFNHQGRSGFSAQDAKVLQLLGSCLSLVLENARLSTTLEKIAVTDELTQVYNYRFLKTALRREMQRAKRFRQPFALIMADVDNLKQYNDRFGHLRGSHLLRELAQLLSRQVRGMDLIAKYGGDEFTAILPQTPRGGSRAVADRLRAAVAEHTFPHVQTGEITISLGLAMFPEDGIQPGSLIGAADAALYAAKQRGRNCVVEATGLVLPSSGMRDQKTA
ncbi:MAG: diguanylate cyclase [Candidatus Eiseniibacteriota bacterium]